MKTIYILGKTTEKWAIISDDEKVDQVVIDRPEHRSAVGNIYIGRVQKVEKSLQAAFVDFGGEKLGFLKKKEIPLSRQQDLSIEQLIHEGQQLWVQVTKDAHGTKGAQLTANVTLPGVHLIYLPYGNYVAVSKKLSGDERHRIKKLGNQWCEKDEGIIFRTASIEQSEETLRDELQGLKQTWDNLQKEAKAKRPPSLMWEDCEIPTRLIRRFTSEDIESIIVDDREIKQTIEGQFPLLQKKCQWVRDLEMQLPLSINQITDKLIQRTIWLDNGAQIQIDQTEAMVIIDVNSAGYTKMVDKQQSVRQTNLSAAKEVARQLRLRNLSGMIFVDFIDMNNKGDQEHLIHIFEQELAKDPVRTEVFGFTRLGLLEMTRKRETPSIPSILMDICPACQGNKQVLSLPTMAYQLERQLLSYSKDDHEVIVIELSPQMAEAFKTFIHMNSLKSLLYKELYVMNNRKSDQFYSIRYVGSKETLKEQTYFHDGSIDRFF